MIERLVSFWDCLFLGQTVKFLGCRCLLFHKTLNGTESPRTMVRCDQALRWRFLKDRWWFQICFIFKFDTYCILQLGWFNHHLGCDWCIFFEEKMKLECAQRWDHYFMSGFTINIFQGTIIFMVGLTCRVWLDEKHNTKQTSKSHMRLWQVALKRIPHDL